MFNYHAFGLDISSEIELPGILEAVGNDNIDVIIFRRKIDLPFHRESPNYHVKNNVIYLWWEEIGQVSITAGREIAVDVFDEDQIIPFLLGPVMAILLHQKGFLVLHGSAVKINDGAVAFLGYRGFGKSTTVINLYKKGYPLVADDILAITFDNDDKPIVYPGYLHVRLSDESYTNIKDSTEILTPIRTIAGKLFCDASYGFSQKPLKLRRIYLLDKNDEIKIYNLNNQDNLLNLITHSTANYSFTDNEQVKNLFKCSKLINNVIIKGLKVNHSFKEINNLIKLIEDDLNID